MLRGGDLGDKVLFGGCSLPGADLIGTNLSRADLTDVNLRWANFTSADLHAADFTVADLAFTDFTNANLQDATLSVADLYNANFTNANLQSATLSLAILSEATLTLASLSDADLTDVYLWDANLTDADLREATLTGANLKLVTLSNANLQGADLTDVSLQLATLTGANLQLATLTGADLRVATLSGVNLREATLNRSYLEGASLESADLDSADLTDARMHNCRLQNVYITKETTFGDQCIYEREASDAEDQIEQFNKAISVYRTYQQLHRENSLPGDVPMYYYREKEMRRVKAFTEGNRREWVSRALQRWVMGYGERPWRVVGTSLVAILVFAGLYPLAGGVELETELTGPEFLKYLYFSGVTFTTLGYGDIHPLTQAAQQLAVIQSFFGAAMMALLVAVLARRVTR